MKENITQSLKEKDVSSCETLEDAEYNQEKEDTDEARKVAELKEKEDADARKVKEEKQKELEEARKVAELKEKEDAEAHEKQARLEAGEAIREADEKKRQEEEDKKTKQGRDRGHGWKMEKQEETSNNEGEGFFTPVGAQMWSARK